MKSKTRLWILGMLFGVFAIGSAIALRTTKSPAPPPTVKAISTLLLSNNDIFVLKPVLMSQGLELTGTLKSTETAWVKAKVAGELQSIRVREGDAVKAGDVVAQIDPTEYLMRLKQAQQQAESAAAQVKIAQRQLANNQALLAQGFISPTALETSVSNQEAALANHRAALAAVDLAQKAVEDTQLKAPIGALVSQRLAQPGERLSLDFKILELVNPKQLELEATLNAADTVQIRIGQPVQIDVEGFNKPIAGSLARINPSTQSNSRSVVVYVKVNAVEGLRQGLFATGKIQTHQSRQLAVPVTAIRTDKPKPYIQILDNKQVKHVDVSLGIRGKANGESMTVVSELAEGAVILREHVGKIEPGTPIELNQLASGLTAQGQ